MTKLYRYKEETILEPYRTQWRCEGWLRNVDHLMDTNRYGEYSVHWAPAAYSDFQNLHELVQQAVSEVQLSMSPYSRKVATPMVENRFGDFYSEQLFLPRLNIKVEHPTELLERRATLSGHMRDISNGKIFLQVDYIDVDDINNGIESSNDSASEELPGLMDW